MTGTAVAAPPRPPVLRRLGRTGRTVSEVGFTPDPSVPGPAGGGLPPSASVAWYAGIRFFLLPDGGPDLTELGGAPGEAVLATYRPAHAGGPATAGDDPCPGGELGLLDGDVSALLHPDLLAAVHDARARGKLELVGVRLRDAGLAEKLLATGVVDVVELAFGLAEQQLLADCLPLLRSWGGGVVLRLAPAGPQSTDHAGKLQAACAARFPGRSLRQLAVQAGLLSDVVSVVVAPCHSAAQVQELVACSRELPPLEPAELDRTLRHHGVPSRLSALAGQPSAARPRRPVPGSQAGRDDRSILSESWSLGPLRLRNRIVRSGTTERAVDGAGMPVPAMRAIHERLATGGAGLIVTGFLAVAPDARASASHGVLEPGPAVAAWREIVESARALSPGTAFCAQLGHGGALSPAGHDEQGLVRRYQLAARAAAEAGFDAVQLHGAHGYLLGQLLAQPPSLRTVKQRHRGLQLVRRVVVAVREELGPHRAVLLKLNSSDFVAAGYDQRDALVAVGELAPCGVDGVEWSGWAPTAPTALSPSRLGDVEWRSEGFFAPFAAQTKAAHPCLAVGTCGGFRSGRGMARAVVEHGLDFVSLSRPLIAEPDLPRKVLGGSPRALCDGCNRCLAKHVRPLHCPRGPELLDDWRLEHEADRPRSAVQ